MPLFILEIKVGMQAIKATETRGMIVLQHSSTNLVFYIKDILFNVKLRIFSQSYAVILSLL